jgi:hypothetical protein
LSGFKILALIALIFELLLAIPVVGGTIVIGTAYIALAVTLIVHIAALVFAPKGNKFAPVFGIVTSLLAWIPFLGWVLHVIAFVLYVVALIKKN